MLGRWLEIEKKIVFCVDLLVWFHQLRGPSESKSRDISSVYILSEFFASCSRRHYLNENYHLGYPGYLHSYTRMQSRW